MQPAGTGPLTHHSPARRTARLPSGTAARRAMQEPHTETAAAMLKFESAGPLFILDMKVNEHAVITPLVFQPARAIVRILFLFSFNVEIAELFVKKRNSTVIFFLSSRRLASEHEVQADNQRLDCD